MIFITSVYDDKANPAFNNVDIMYYALTTVFSLAIFKTTLAKYYFHFHKHKTRLSIRAHTN